MDVERALICKALDLGDMTPIFSAHIRLPFFQDQEHAQVFKWMVEFWERYSASPTRDALLREYPDYDYIEVEEPYPYLVDEMLKERRYVLMSGGMDIAIETMRAYDPDGAMAQINRAIEQIYAETPSTTDEDLCATTKERRVYYNQIRLRQGLLGIPTGFNSFDRATSGLQEEQLITLIGLPKTGKSTMLLHMAITAHQHAYRPLFVSFEMSNREQTTRHDVLRAGISYSRLTNGKLRSREKVKLDRMLRGLEDMPPFMMVHDPASTTTVAALASKISQVKPDVVFVDGTYLMQCEDPKLDPTSPQGLTSITRSMKRLAQRAKVPIVQTTQALASKYSRKGGGLKLYSIGYSSSFAQDSDVILGVEDDEVLKNQYIVKIVAARNASRQSVEISVDWTKGAITEEEREQEDEEPDEEESNA
jgi:replicative DNA helicase